MAVLVIVALLGVSLLDLEIWGRRTLGLSVYGKGDPYLTVRERLRVKYADVKSGEMLRLKGLSDPDLPIIYLRSDLDFTFPPGAKKY